MPLPVRSIIHTSNRVLPGNGLVCGVCGFAFSSSKANSGEIPYSCEVRDGGVPAGDSGRYGSGSIE